MTFALLICAFAFGQEMLLKKDVVEQKFGEIMFYRYKIIQKVQKNGNESITDEKGKPLDGHYNIADKRGNYVDVSFKNGRKHGNETSYDYNGRKLTMKSYKDGKKTGKFERYFKDGTTNVKGYYLDGFQDGRWEYFNLSGKLKSYETYKKGRKDGEWWERKKSRGSYYVKTGVYKSDIPVGVWTEKWEDGKEKEKITYSGKGTYIKKTFYNTGELKNQESYKDFKLDGIQLSYTKSNVLLEKTTYKNGLVEKEERFFDTGRPHKTYRKVNGKYHGKFIIYKRSGKKELEGEYNQGYKTGLWKTYIGDEGLLSYEINYKNDTQHGLKKAYNYTGKLKYQGNYNNGEKDGLWKWYNKDGKMIKEVSYELGNELFSTHKSYYSNGILREHETYNNSKLDGAQLTYSKSKTLIQKLTYKEGELLKEEKFFETGSPRETYNRKNGDLHGKFVIYNEFGTKSEEGEYANGYKTGLWKKYQGRDSWLKEEINFNNNLKNGLIKLYFDSGKVELQGNFTNGKRDGVWKWYNERGKLIRENNYKLGKELSSKTFN